MQGTLCFNQSTNFKSTNFNLLVTENGLLTTSNLGSSDFTFTGTGTNTNTFTNYGAVEMNVLGFNSLNATYIIFNYGEYNI